MTGDQQQTVVCEICGQPKQLNDVLPGELIRPAIMELIRRTVPAWSPGGYVCLNDLNRLRTQYIQEVMEKEGGELSDLEREVVESLREQELLSADINAQFDRELTLGERIADQVAEFGGSWRFISMFGFVLLLWILGNSIVLLWRPFDPYPFILLNLVLSCLAAIQAPVIMMSQNRQETKDRLRAENDYRVNLKAELEIRHLHAKMDLLLTHQWRRLLEIQQIQTDLMEELVRQNSPSKDEHPHT
jgi:uncharacterized membrane protein